MKKKLSGYVYRKTTVFVLLVLLQLSVLILSVWRMVRFFPYVYAGLMLLSIVVLVWVVNSDANPSYKLAWAIPILLIPIFGGIFYLLFGTSKVSSKLKKSMEQQKKYTIHYLKHDPDLIGEELPVSPAARLLMQYTKNAGYPLYPNEETVYFPLGDDLFPKMLEEIKKAKEYIFIEYFIIADGFMWEKILAVLQEKVREGVEVRVLFDDCGSWGLLPAGYEKTLREMGILCRVFNPLHPSLTITMNNRDHRKILIIDGQTAFTGGVNIGDEYINHIALHGHWKDSSVMFRGQAVKTLLSLFFEMWNLVAPYDEDVSCYYKQFPAPAAPDGYLQPYGSDPFCQDTVGENIYLHLIAGAAKELLIMTPYLIIDNELTTALCLAAKSGVAVTILTPHICDKWYVHLMTRASYPQLIRAGVQIFEYTPGFVHSKIFVADGEIATVGTINLDYRSLYLHFECGTILYRAKAVQTIREDYLHTLERAQKISLEDEKKLRWYERLFQRLVRAFSPLM